MNLYLLERRGTVNYDEFDSVVVCAESAAKARMIHPKSNSPFPFYDSYRVGVWNGVDDTRTWVNADSIKLDIKYIGKAASGMEPGVVLASFNAG